MSNNNVMTKLKESYMWLSATQFAMNYYSLFEGWVNIDEGEENRLSLDKIPCGKQFLDELCVLSTRAFNDFDYLQDDLSKLCNALDSLRNRVKDSTMTIAAFSDRFKLYEYIFNRIKPDDVQVKDINNDAYSRDILSAIFETGDNPVINQNIKFAVSQLPIRMTKAKFYDILNNSVQRYIGTDRGALERMTYMLKSSSGLGNLEIKGFEGGELNELKSSMDFFMSTDYTGLGGTAFTEAQEKLNVSIKLIADTADFYQALAGAVNQLYAYCLTADKADDEAKADLKNLKIIVDEASNGIVHGIKSEMTQEVYDAFVSTEGRIEKENIKIERAEGRLSDIKSSGPEDDALAEKLDRCRKLLSLSLFIDLDDTSDDEVLVDQDYADATAKALVDDYEHYFKGLSRHMKRAVMSAALAEMPVFFNSRTEVMNYVRDSIDGCRDTFEKVTSVQLVLDTLKG